MNIITLQTPTGDTKLAQQMLDKFMAWIRSTNTDLSTMTGSQIYQRLYDLNGIGNPTPANAIQRPNPYFMEQVYQSVLRTKAEHVLMANVEQETELPLTQPGQVPLPREMDDELYDMIFPLLGPANEDIGKGRDNVPPLMDE